MLEEAFHFVTEETSPHLVEEKLDDVKIDDYKEIEVISALNHFFRLLRYFCRHELGYKLISYNAPVDEENRRIDAFCEQKICGAILLHFFQTFLPKIKKKNYLRNLISLAKIFKCFNC